MCWKYPFDFEPNTGREIIDAQSKFAWGFSYLINPFFPTVPTCAVRETASLSIMGAPRVPLLNPSETIVLSIVSERFKGGTRGAPIMPRDGSPSDSKCWNGWQKWVDFSVQPAALQSSCHDLFTKKVKEQYIKINVDQVLSKSLSCYESCIFKYM